MRTTATNTAQSPHDYRVVPAGTSPFVALDLGRLGTSLPPNLDAHKHAIDATA